MRCGRAIGAARKGVACLVLAAPFSLAVAQLSPNVGYEVNGVCHTAESSAAAAWCGDAIEQPRISGVVISSTTLHYGVLTDVCSAGTQGIQSLFTTLSRCTGTTTGGAATCTAQTTVANRWHPPFPTCDPTAQSVTVADSVEMAWKVIAAWAGAWALVMIGRRVLK